MKIIFANNYFYIRGGSEKVFIEEMELLQRKGHLVFPFTRKFEHNFLSEFEKFFPSELIYDNCNFSEKVKSAINLIYSTEVKKKFEEYLGFIKPDIIHAHNIYGRLTSSLIDGAKKASVAVVMTLHDYKLLCPSYLMLNKENICEKCLKGNYLNCFFTKCHKNSFIASAIYTIESYFNKLFKKYDYVSFFICPSMFSLKKHNQAGIPEKKLEYIPNFLNTENFEPLYKAGDYILYAGRLSKEKGIMTLLKAMKNLDIKLKIVGDGPLRQDCEKFVRENNIINVEFLGYKTGDELKNLYRNSAFLVMPSEWYENAPMTILEAFAYGKPVIGSKIGGIPEMVIDGETGVLFEEKNWVSLQEKIRELIHSPTLIERMGRNGRNKVEKEHSSESHYEKLINLYKRALSP